MEYEVIINFGGFIGADESYTVYADNEEEAENLALAEAEADLSIEDICQISEDEWEVEVGFAEFLGVSNTYTVYADNENKACEAATEEAVSDLYVDEVI